MTNLTTPAHHHRWNFFRAGGFDQVRLDTGADIAHLEQLDRKLWVALACPTRGLEFDHKTLDLIDTDGDGRIRAPEILAAARFACAMLKNPDDLIKGNAALPLAAINEGTPEGKTLHSSARQILINLGKPEAAAITTEDTADTVKIFASTQFNGDGILPSDSATDPFMQLVIADVITCLGAEMDRSGKPGITQAKLDLFFADAEAFASWHGAIETDAEKFPLGANTAVGAAAMKAVAGKIEDYFARCRLAAFDVRATAAVNRAETDYAALATKDLTTAAAEIAAFPLARIVPNLPLPLSDEAHSINPAWRDAIETLHTQVIQPLLGEKQALNETDWATLLAKFAPSDAWLATKAGATVEKLGLERVRAILGSNAKAEITALIAKDKALEPEATSIVEVDRLVRYHRDLHKLLINFVNFRDFYGRHERAVFQVGTLFLDQRSCDLCVRVEDAARHGLMAHLSRTYLAYCDCTRKGAEGNPETMTIAAAFTGGDSDNLMVGRNGIFFDRQGHDWDATITKIIENPISIRQAFFAPYKRLIRFVSDQVAKRAADADAAASARAQAAAGTVIDTAIGNAPPPPPPPPKPKLDVGVVAALGVAVGALSTAFSVFLAWLSGVPLMFLPIYIAVIVLLISGPSMIIAFFKLRQRNLGPILDANGWAVNAKAKVNIPFGRSLTGTPKLPPGSHRDLVDPFAEKHTGRNWTIAIVVVIVAVLSVWYFGLVTRYLPDGFPKSSWTLNQEQAAADRATASASADTLFGNVDAALENSDVVKAKWEMTKLKELEPKLSGKYKTQIDALQKSVDDLAKTPATTRK
jgi:hypothetical protein